MCACGLDHGSSPLALEEPYEDVCSVWNLCTGSLLEVSYHFHKAGTFIKGGETEGVGERLRERHVCVCVWGGCRRIYMHIDLYQLLISLQSWKGGVMEGQVYLILA